MLKSFLFLSLLVGSTAFAQKLSLDARRTEILKIVDEELDEVSRLAKQQEYRSPETVLRLSELNLEKARLWREAENEQYVNIPPEKRKNINRKDFFKRSGGYFNKANESAEMMIKRFPKYKGLGEVYYILAYNHKELGEHDQAKKYFALSTKKTSGNPTILAKSKLALADYYFNDHKYKESIPLYEASLNNVNERWWTKDAFNLAWSYYRVKNYDKAISLMKEVHRKSADSKYIDMRSMVERDIGVFFVDSNRMNEAIKFYENLGLNYTEQFVKIANAIVSQGRFAQAESLLEQAAKTEKDRGRKIDILISQLDLFDKYGKVPPHLKVSKELVALHKEAPLGEDQLKRLVYHVNKKAAELQKATASDIYKSVQKVKKQKSVDAIAYFELSAQLSPGQKAEKTFYQGETAYAAGEFGRAINLYISSFDLAKTNSDKKIMSQSLEGMLSALGQPSLSDKAGEKFYIPVYSRYLSADSKSEKANAIFVKLFNTQYDAGDVPAAEKTMADFADNFPKDYKTQEGMLAKVMDYYRKKKDYSKVKSYVADINSGKFKVSKKYADALRSLMTKIQVEGVQQSLEKGQKGVALKGYHQIYESADSTPKAKTNAAYNLSALYYELGDTAASYKWGVVALKDMDTDDVAKFTDSFLSISAGLFLKQNFTLSSDLSYRLLVKLCKHNSSNKVVAYKNAVFIALANGELDRALEIRDFGKGCSISEITIAEVSFEVLKELASAKRWESLEKLIHELEANSKNYPLLIKPYEDLRRETLALGEVQEARSMENQQKKFFEQSRAQKLDIPVEALDIIAEKALVTVRSKKDKIDEVRLSFPEGDFNNAVKLKLQLLDQMATEVNGIQKIGSGVGIVEAYKLVITAYEDFGSTLKAFVPEGKSPEYVSSFQKAMSEVYNPILANARKQRSEIRKLINDNKILSLSNYAVLYPTVENFKRYLPSKEAVLMERGGKR